MQLSKDDLERIEAEERARIKIRRQIEGEEQETSRLAVERAAQVAATDRRLMTGVIAWIVFLAILASYVEFQTGDVSQRFPHPTPQRSASANDADYGGGPFIGRYESVDRIALPSGAWFDVGDPLEAVVAALRTMDITTYDRTFHLSETHRQSC